MTVVARRRTAATDFAVLPADRALPARLVNCATSLPGSAQGRLPVEIEYLPLQIIVIVRDGHQRSHNIG